MNNHRNSILFLFLFLPQQILSQIQLKHIIDFSETGETLFFSAIDTNQFEIKITPFTQDQRLCFFISHGAAFQTITFRLKTGVDIFNPSYSYDENVWHSIKWCWQEGEYVYFKVRSDRNTIFIALNENAKLPGLAQKLHDVPYYSYERYLSLIDSIAFHPFVEKRSLGTSVQGRDIHLLTISDPDFPGSDKKSVWFNFRQHCDEFEQSYIQEGLFHFLLSAEHASDAQKILERIIFKIVPIVNVDGVFHRWNRVNANGVDLNRCWVDSTDHDQEEPEVRAVHDEMDDWILNKGNKISFALDMHGWGNSYDGGYRSLKSVVGEHYVAEQETFLSHLISEDPWQQWHTWSFSEGHPRMIRLALWRQHRLNILTSETTGGSRFNGVATTIENLRQQGAAFCKAINRYLFHIYFVNTSGDAVETHTPSDSIVVLVDDRDEDNWSNAIDSVAVILTSSIADTEFLKLPETELNSGRFLNRMSVPIAVASPIPQDGTLQVVINGEVFAAYRDDDFTDDFCTAKARIIEPALVQTVEGSSAINSYELCPNYPNPFNDVTMVPLKILNQEVQKLPASIAVYNLMGQRIQLLCQESLGSGMHYFKWDGRDRQGFPVVSGVYLIQASAGNWQSTRKLLLLR